jgi:pimeloyl-ACP methyl ester carboxylesterase
VTFREGHIEIDGARVSYLEAGQGPPLVHLHSAGERRLTPASDVLCRRFRVVVLEAPEPRWGEDALARALTQLGVDSCNLVGTALAAGTVLRFALQAPDRVRALVLEAPAAPDGQDSDAELERRLPALATPTLVLLGTADEVTAPALGRACKARMPNCHLALVYAAGHAISADRPEAFAEVVGDFLERHEAFVISRAETVIHP